MTCEKCRGKGFVYEDRPYAGVGVKLSTPVPCDECGGCGITHCCEGERPGNVPEE